MNTERTTSEKLAAYPCSEQGNFRVKDIIGVPHPYCIMPKHVAIAADHHGGLLDRHAIEDAEQHGAKCGTCHGKLKYSEHETALLIGCRAPIKSDDGKATPELHKYLLSIVDQATRD